MKEPQKRPHRSDNLLRVLATMSTGIALDELNHLRSVESRKGKTATAKTLHDESVDVSSVVLNRPIRATAFFQQETSIAISQVLCGGGSNHLGWRRNARLPKN